jgi:hypothetical protein
MCIPRANRPSHAATIFRHIKTFHPGMSTRVNRLPKAKAAKTPPPPKVAPPKPTPPVLSPIQAAINKQHRKLRALEGRQDVKPETLYRERIKLHKLYATKHGVARVRRAA